MSLTAEFSWASHARPGMDDLFITLMGTQGTVELYVANYARENTLTFYTEIDGVPVVTHPAVKSGGSDHHFTIAEFVNCIREETEPAATAEQGLIIMQMIEAIYESAAQEREVVLQSMSLSEQQPE